MEDKKVSIITACKNRVDALKISLMSWLNFKEVSEIIIVDWSSDEPINYLTELDSRIKVVRVNDKQYFNQPQPLNLAAKIASGDYILKLDSDHVLNPYHNFIDKYFPIENNFVSGSLDFDNPEVWSEEHRSYIVPSNYFEDLSNGRKMIYAYSPLFKHLRGLLFINKKFFNDVGGYNENLGDHYAYEDEEMYNRLKLYGLNEIKLSFDYMALHLPHQDKKRYENFKKLSYHDEFVNNVRSDLQVRFSHFTEEELEWNIEYALAEEHIKRNKIIVGEIENYYVPMKTTWDIIPINDQNLIAYDISITNNPLESFPSVRCISLEECEDRRNILSKSFEKYQITPKFILSKRYSESNDKITGKYVHTLNDGTKGCCVSHLKMIKDWYETTNEEYGFFCEDDLSLETIDFWEHSWREFFNTRPSDAECLQLLTIRQEFDTFDLRERYWDDWGATAYILNRSGAKKIIDNYIKNEYGEDVYHLEISHCDVQPLIENIIFASVVKTYTIPLFVENIDLQSTFQDMDDDCKNGHKNNHINAHHKVIANFMGKLHVNNLSQNFEVKEPTELETLLTAYSLDTENPEYNFNLGVFYDREGHTAPALSYFLRCAERASESDPTLAYEALIRGSYCYFKQGTRDGSGRGMLWQAQMFLPNRPEAYYLLARYASKNEWWQDTYSTTQLALMVCDFSLPPLRTDVQYPGKYGILYQKSVSAWWWGKENETRSLLQEIKNNHHHEIKDKKHFDTMQDTLIKLATGYISEDEIKYNKYSGKNLRFIFEGSDKIEKNYSQSFQDLFILSALKGKRNGLYLEIGAQEPFYQNNTALLETEFGWDGISIEIKVDLCKMFSEQRKNKILCADATQVDYLSVLNEFNKGTTFDYLQLDCEPSEVTYQILLKIPFDHYKFAIITYEHDHYVDLTNSYRTKSREYLMSKGYKILVPNVSPNECSPFEDWWYHPDLIDSDIIENMKVDGDVVDVRSYMIQSN